MAKAVKSTVLEIKDRTPSTISEVGDVLRAMSAEDIAVIMDSITDLVCICVERKIQHINTMGMEMMQANSPDELLGHCFQDFVCDDFSASVENIIAVMADEKDATPLRIKTIKSNMVSFNLKVVTLPGHEKQTHVIIGENLTVQAKMAEAIHQSKARFRKLVNNALDLICVMDQGQISYINKAGLKLLKAKNEDDVVNKGLDTFLHNDYKGIFSDNAAELAAEDMLIPVRLLDFEGNPIEAEIGVTLLDDVSGQNYMIEARDITAHNRAVTALRASIENLEQRVQARTRALQEEVAERRRAEEMLRHVATHDGLTDLPNRALLMDRLDSTIAQAKRNQTKCAVVFIDLDGFKPINDTLGHDKGDLVLRETATRLNACIRETDTAARFGGDEFVVVLSNLNEAEDASPVAQKVIDSLSIPIEFENGVANIGASIGIALYPDHGSSAEDIIKRADAAMYDVKGSGKNNYSYAKD
ncbi:MAG: diguanylate cyclase [Magnetovibrio sp.]|nr:diguanylate cyclase [Magnetovibrio sp.]